MRTGIPKILAAVVVVLVWCAAATGEPNSAAVTSSIVELNRFLTLKDYVNYAEAHNTGLKNGYQQWVAATEEAVQAKTLPDPHLTYGASPQEIDMYERQQVIITQMLPWFGKIGARAETAARNAESAKQKYMATRLLLLKDIKTDFYEYAYLAKAADIIKETIDLLKSFNGSATTNNLTAKRGAGRADAVRLRTETAKLEEMLKGQEQQCEPVISRLKSSLNLPADINLPPPAQENFEPAPLDYDMLVNLMRQKNPELAGLNSEAMAAKSRVKLAEKNFYPDVGIGLQFEQVRRPGNTQDSSRDAAIMLSLSVPLWQDGYRSEQRQAVAEATKIEQQRIKAENDILTKASQTYCDYNDSVQEIELYRKTLLPQAKEQLRSAQTAYNAGKTDLNPLLDAQQAFMDYRLAYQRAMADNKQKLAELEMLAGTELDKQQ